MYSNDELVQSLNYFTKKLKVIATIAIKIPNIRKGIVYRVDIAARLVMTTNANDTMAVIIREKTAPLSNMAAIVSGKMTADITIIDTPTQAIWYLS